MFTNRELYDKGYAAGRAGKDRNSTLDSAGRLFSAREYRHYVQGFHAGYEDRERAVGNLESAKERLLERIEGFTDTVQADLLPDAVNALEWLRGSEFLPTSADLIVGGRKVKLTRKGDLVLLGRADRA